MGDTDSDSFQSADEEDLSAQRKIELKKSKSGKAVDNLKESSATVQHVERELNTVRTADYDSFTRKSIWDDDDDVVKELERPWVQEGMEISEIKTATNEMIFEGSVSSCESHPDTECHCKKDEQAENVANTAAKAEMSENRAPNVEKKTSNVEMNENKMPNVEKKTSNVKMKTSNVKMKTSNVKMKTSNVEMKTSNVEMKMSNVEINDNKTSNVEMKTSNVEININKTSNVEMKASNVEMKMSNVEMKTSNVEINDNKTSNVEKKTSNVESSESDTSTIGQGDDKSLNVESVDSSDENIQISPSGMLEMTSVLDVMADPSKPAQKTSGPWGWSTWGTSMLNTAAQSGTTWGSSLLNTATASGSGWGQQMLNTATASGSVWGTQLLNTATSSVSTFRSQVGEGLNTVLQTVESTFGAPSPEDLAAQVMREGIPEEDVSNLDGDLGVLGEKSPARDEKLVEDRSVIPEEFQFIGRGLLSTVSTVTTAIESTSNKVIKGSLDTLEIIGKKTMDVIQDGDPGLQNKRAAVRKLTLSEVLREAKKKYETVDETSSTVKEAVRKVNYTTWFDEYHGLVSLEALELVSKNCEAKVTSILAHIEDVRAKEEMESRLAVITDTCVTEESDDDSSDDSDEDITEVVSERLKTLGDSISFSRLDEVYLKGDKLVAKWREQREDANLNMSIISFHEHYGEAVKLLAEITARAVEMCHKMAELLLLPQKMAAGEAARCLTDFTSSLCVKINYFASKFSECHQYNYERFGAEHKETINEFITNVFLEASNSCSFIQDSLHLVVPVLQLKVATDVRERS